MSNKPNLALRLTVSVLGGAVLSVSEPAAFLDQEVAMVVLQRMPTGQRGQTALVTLPAKSCEEEIARQIFSLKSMGVRGVLLFVPAHRARGAAVFREALHLEGVVWVTDPRSLAPTLARFATCRPLLVCTRLGSAVIAEPGPHPMLSATALALTCAEDVATFKRIGDSPFKLLFPRGRNVVQDKATNAFLACVALQEDRPVPRYSTPAGQKAPVEYAADVCQALLDRRYLIELDISARCTLAGLIGLLFACLKKPPACLVAAILLMAVLFVTALLAKAQLPIGSVALICIFTLATRDLFVRTAVHAPANC